MPSTVTDYFRIQNADLFKRLVSSSITDTIYIALGRHLPWAIDSEPPFPDDNDEEILYRRWDRFLAAAKVIEADVQLSVSRINWTANTVYDQYDATDTQLSNKSFYVLNSENRVYKVLDNNGGAQSTAEPTGAPDTSFQTADGYTWQYMYTIDAGTAAKFLNPQFMPVLADSSVQAAAESSTNDIYNEPIEGHGFNPTEELRAFFAQVSVQVGSGSSSDLFIDNEYREISLLSNPRDTSDNIATNQFYDLLTNATVSNISGTFQPDEILVDQNAGTSTQARVIQFDDINSVVRYKLDDPNDDFAVGAVLEGSTSGATATVDSIDSPDLKLYSGRIIVSENRPQVNRAENQTETLTTVLEF